MIHPNRVYYYTVAPSALPPAICLPRTFERTSCTTRIEEAVRGHHGSKLGRHSLPPPLPPFPLRQTQRETQVLSCPSPDQSPHTQRHFATCTLTHTPTHAHTLQARHWTAGQGRAPLSSIRQVCGGANISDGALVKDNPCRRATRRGENRRSQRLSAGNTQVSR